MSRGNERCDIFVDEHDRNGFLDAIEDLSERFEEDSQINLTVNAAYSLDVIYFGRSPNNKNIDLYQLVIILNRS